MNTPDDVRIKLAEKGIGELESAFQNLRIQRRREYLDRIRGMASMINVIKYSFMPSDSLTELDEFKKLLKEAEFLKESLKFVENGINLKKADYWTDYLLSLPELILRGDEIKTFEAIRYFSGEITSVEPMNGLYLCLVDCGFRLRVVTNSESFTQGRYAVVAYLPPRTFDGTISEGMFVDVSLDKRGELNPEEIKSIGNALGEVESMIIALIS